MRVKKRHIVLVVLVVALVAARLALPWVLRTQINKRLAALPDYEGHVDRVHLALWRGAFGVKDFALRHHDGRLGVEIQSAEVSVVWPHLFRGAFVGNIRVVRPRVELVVASPAQAGKEAKEKGKEAERTFEEHTGKTIPEAIQSLIPFRVDNFDVLDGSVYLRETGRNAEKHERAPEEAAFLTDLDATVKNLTNSRKISESLVATADVTGKITGTGHIDLKLKFDPVAEQPRFDITIEIQKFQLVALNRLLEWQTGLHFDQGTFALYSEASAADGGFEGYVKPLIENLQAKVVSGKKNVFQKAKQVVINVAAVVFENRNTKQVATRVPFKGRFENPSAGIVSAVVSLLRNAFVEAIKPGLDPGIRFDERGKAS